MPNFDNIKDKGFDKRPENINRNGAPKKISIRKELETILGSDGVVKYSGKQIVEIGETEAGEKFVKIKLPTQQALAQKMISIAMGSNKSSNTLRAIIQILEQFDGKPTQNINDISENKETIIFQNVSDKYKIDKYGKSIKK
jgi:hypothetical protein